MSEKDKKPGARDISDLKARLGIKKGGGAVQVQGGVPSPSAAKIGGGFVPPPPGVAPPPGPQQPQQPPPPDASVDPFGAMNHAAKQGAQNAAPQFVIVDDGKPVEKVSSTEKMLRYVKLAVMLITPLVLGYVFGGINTKNGAWNKTVADAKRVFEDFKVVKTNLQKVQDALDLAKDKGKGKIKDMDTELATTLGELKLQRPDPALLYHSNLYNMPPDVVEQVYQFYGRLGDLFDKINTHIAATKADSKKAEYRMPNLKFATIFHMPKTDGDGPKVPWIEVVELGDFKCVEGQPFSQVGCPDGLPISFKARISPTGQWAKEAPVAKAAGVADNNIVYFGPDVGAEPNEVMKIMFSGAEPWVDRAAYRKRIDEIVELTTALNETRAKLETTLNNESNRAKRFAL